MSLERRPIIRLSASQHFLLSLEADSRRASRRDFLPPEGRLFVELLQTAIEADHIEAVKELIFQSSEPEKLIV